MTADDAQSTLNISTLSLPDRDVTALQSRLFEHHHILTQAFASERKTPEINGLRITPNVYSSLTELDALAVALREELRQK